MRIALSGVVCNHFRGRNDALKRALLDCGEDGENIACVFLVFLSVSFAVTDAKLSKSLCVVRHTNERDSNHERGEQDALCFIDL